jgi:hypothetical protein
MKKTLTITAITFSFAILPAIAAAQNIGVRANIEMRANASSTMGRPQLGILSSSTAARREMMASTSAAHEERMASTTAARQEERKQMQQNNVEKRVDAAVNTANHQIEARIDALNKLASRISEMKNVSDAQKATISTEVQTQIGDLNALLTKIQSEASSTTNFSSTTAFRTDVKSITDGYRIYALVIPQGSILSAVDRVNTLATSMTTLSAKLQARISAAQTAGIDVTSLNAALADLNAKVADAKTQATAAAAKVSGLTPDNGDKTVAASNAAAIKAGQANIRVADTDIKAAYKDAEMIVKALAGKQMKVTASTTVTTSTSATTSVQ